MNKDEIIKMVAIGLIFIAIVLFIANLIRGLV